MAPKRATRSTRVPPVTPAPNATTTTVTEAQLQALINQGVAAAMAEAEASRVRNGYNSNGSGPRPAQTARECSYSEFLKCKPLDFKGTEGVVGLTRWFEKMESVFSISNCPATSQVKFATCTLQDDALTWWNSHVKTTTPEVAHAMPWAVYLCILQAKSLRQEHVNSARDEKLVSTKDRVKIGKSNIRIDPTLTQKEKTYQVILDIIKDTLCYNSFLITADVHETYIQKFWFTIKKEFTVPPSHDSLMEFLLELGYKGQLRHISEMFVDQMHQPWRTLGAIINICLSGKTSSNDRLQQSRIEIFQKLEDVISCPIQGLPKSSFTTSCLNTNQFQRKGSCYNTVYNDAVLDRLKFINKGDMYQVYRKPIPDTLITDDTKISKAYKTFIAISTGLIPQKKGRDKAAQGTKAAIIPKKKKPKKKVSIREESDDKEERLVRRKPRAQLEIDTHKAIKASKHENIFQYQSVSSSEGAGLGPEVFDEPTWKFAVSNEGAGTSPEVLDETKEKVKLNIILKIGVSLMMRHLFEDKEENPEDIPWVSTDDDESENDDEEDDVSIDIEKTNDERTDTDVEDQDDEELKVDEEQKGDDQAGDEQLVVLVSTTQKEMPSPLQSTSSHFVSSNFGNQFINSPNASIISTIPENAKAKINSLLDIQIQQDVPHIQQEPFHIVKVFTKLEKAVKELKQADHSTTILASIKSQVLQSHTEELKKELSEKRDYKDVIKESVQANIINKVKNFLPKFLSQAVKEELEKTPSSFGQSSSKGQSAIKASESLSEYELKNILYAKMHKIQSHLTYDTHQELYDALTWSMLLDEATMKEGDKPDNVLKKRDRGYDQDEDPSARSNQGKKTKKRRFNESESSKKTSTTKESSKGKSPARTSKSGKSVTAKESVKEPIFEIASDDVEQTFDDKVGDAGQPPHIDADKTQPDDAPRIPKKDWLKEAPRPETLDPDWNTVKTVDDTPEQSWFNEIVKAEKPPLTFEELMSTPIDFSAFAMNRLKLNKITRADLVGLMFNLLKGVYKSCVELVYNMEECYRALTDQLDWENPKGHKSQVDMSKPLPLQDKEAARHTLERIEDMIPTLWNPVIIDYDKDAALGISYLGPQQGDLPDLHLNDIEDRLLLIAQNKLFNLKGDVIVEFVMALKMFTRGIIIKNRIQDVQLGVENYQRKLNLTKPQRTCQHISVKEPYTLNYDPPGIIYEDKSKKKRMMRVDEIHKFCDETLQSVCKILHERLLNFKFGYNKDMPLKMTSEKLRSAGWWKENRDGQKTAVEDSTSKKRKTRQIAGVKSDHLKWNGLDENERDAYNQRLSKLQAKAISLPKYIDWVLSENYHIKEELDELITIIFKGVSKLKDKESETRKVYKPKEQDMRGKAEEVEKANAWRDAMLLKTGYQLDYALPILIHLGKNSGFTFDSDYDPPMVPPYPYPTTPFTTMENASNADVEHVEESLNDDGVGDKYGGDFEDEESSMTDTSMGSHEKQVVSRFLGKKRGASVELEDEDTKSDETEHSDNEDDDNADDDRDEE
ncbi:hypothetical protein Tco_1263178 [Tanacetum coccineum]